MRSLAPSDLRSATKDLCARYSVDLAGLSRAASMDWSDVATLAADPKVTIGSATVNYPVLSNLKEAAALREMTMGKAVAEAALQRAIRHFAYPFGDRAAFRRPHVLMSEEAGFVSAVSTIAGIVEAEGRTNLHALPRISLGRSVALVTRHARAAFRPRIRACEAYPKRAAYLTSGRAIQLTIGIAGKTQPRPATT